jgi:hypothetical protein
MSINAIDGVRVDFVASRVTLVRRALAAKDHVVGRPKDRTCDPPDLRFDNRSILG